MKLSCMIMTQSLDLCLSVKDTTVVPGRGPRLVVCRADGLGQQLLHVEGTLKAISRTEATSVLPRHPRITLLPSSHDGLLERIRFTPVLT